jgi:fatty acid desaturase
MRMQKGRFRGWFFLKITCTRATLKLQFCCSPSFLKKKLQDILIASRTRIGEVRLKWGKWHFKLRYSVHSTLLDRFLFYAAKIFSVMYFFAAIILCVHWVLNVFYVIFHILLSFIFVLTRQKIQFWSEIWKNVDGM